MATKSKTVNVDLNSVFEGAASQFRGLNPNEPGQWPLLPKTLTFVAVAFAMVVAGWFVVLSSEHDALDSERNKEPTLKSENLPARGPKASAATTELALNPPYPSSGTASVVEWTERVRWRLSPTAMRASYAPGSRKTRPTKYRRSSPAGPGRGTRSIGSSLRRASSVSSDPVVM